MPGPNGTCSGDGLLATLEVTRQFTFDYLDIG
jgi:hypothetical protein